MSEAAKIPLQYDALRALPWFRQRRTKQIAACILAMALLWWAAIMLPPFWERAKFLRLQDQAAVYQISAASPLLPVPQQPIAPTTILLDKEYWSSWRATHPLYPTSVTGTLLFMHRMVTSTGNERIVAVYGTLAAPTETTGGTLDIYGYACEMSGMKWLIRPSTAKRRAMQTVLQVCTRRIDLKPGDRISVWPGTIDPADASHFTLKYLLNDQPGTLNLNLVDAASPVNESAAGVDFTDTDAIFRTHTWSGTGIVRRKAK